MADSFSARRVAHALTLMQGMRHMVGESAFAESIGYPQPEQAMEAPEAGSSRMTVFMLSSDVISGQNLTETDSRAAPNAPAVTIATGPCAEAMP